MDHVMFWFSCADRQVKTCRSPFSLWDLASKALLTPIRKEAEWQFKYFVDRTKRKSRRRSEKVSKMGGSESKATVLECMIKNFNGFGGDYGVKMTSTYSVRSNGPLWE